jgi:transcriptional regulator with XRE-family HTH domain
MLDGGTHGRHLEGMDDMAKEPERVVGMRRALGAQLATFRTAAGLTQAQLADLAYCDRTRVTHIEKGRSSADEQFWQVADEACHADGVLLVGFQELEAVRLDHEQQVHAAELAEARTKAAELRQGSGSVLPGTATMLQGAHLSGQPSLGLSPTDFLATISVETPVPSRIGWSEVEHARGTTRAVALSENLFGGGLSCEAAIAQLQWAGKLLDASAADEVRRATYEAVGNLASVVAFSAFDIAAFNAADRCFHFALWCAEQGSSWALRANTLAEMSRKAAYVGNIDEAMTLIEFAQVRADRLSATARAMLAALRARLLALAERYDEARAEVEQADAYFAERNPITDPPWLCYYDEAEHQGSTGRAMIPLARTTGQLDLAVPRLEAAVRLHEARYPRSRTFSRTRLASLLMATGYVEDALPIARQAVIDAGSLRSRRLIGELQGLAKVAAPYARSSDVQDLRHDIAALPLAGSDESRQA